MQTTPAPAPVAPASEQHDATVEPIDSKLMARRHVYQSLLCGLSLISAAFCFLTIRHIWHETHPIDYPTNLRSVHTSRIMYDVSTPQPQVQVQDPFAEPSKRHFSAIDTSAADQAVLLLPPEPIEMTFDPSMHHTTQHSHRTYHTQHIEHLHPLREFEIYTHHHHNEMRPELVHHHTLGFAAHLMNPETHQHEAHSMHQPFGEKLSLRFRAFNNTFEHENLELQTALFPLQGAHYTVNTVHEEHQNHTTTRHRHHLSSYVAPLPGGNGVISVTLHANGEFSIIRQDWSDPEQPIHTIQIDHASRHLRDMPEEHHAALLDETEHDHIVFQHDDLNPQVDENQLCKQKFVPPELDEAQEIEGESKFDFHLSQLDNSTAAAFLENRAQIEAYQEAMASDSASGAGAAAESNSAYYTSSPVSSSPIRRRLFSTAIAARSTRSTRSTRSGRPSRWIRCLNEPQGRTYPMGFVADYGFVKRAGGAQAARRLIVEELAQVAAIYQQQMNVALEIHELVIENGLTSQLRAFPNTDWNRVPDPVTKRCAGADMDKTLDQMTKWRTYEQVNYLAAWTLFTDCFPPPGIVGLAWTDQLCSQKYSVAIVSHNALGMKTAAHEIAHVIGAEHAFKKDPRTGKIRHFGGLEDYGDGTYNGIVQFNGAINAQQMCAGLRKSDKRKVIHPHCSRLGVTSPLLVSRKVNSQIDKAGQRGQRRFNVNAWHASLPRPASAALRMSASLSAQVEKHKHHHGFWTSLLGLDDKPELESATIASADESLTEPLADGLERQQQQQQQQQAHQGLTASAQDEDLQDADQAAANSASEDQSARVLMRSFDQGDIDAVDQSDVFEVDSSQREPDDEEEGAQLIFIHRRQTTPLPLPHHITQQQELITQEYTPGPDWRTHMRANSYAPPSYLAASLSTLFGFACGVLLVVSLASLAYISCCQSDSQADKQHRQESRNAEEAQQNFNHSAASAAPADQQLRSLATEDLTSTL